MFKPVLVSVGDVMAHAEKQPVSTSVASDVFRAFHGFYGALFSSKFATGALNDKGQDKGTINARAIWADQLARFDHATVKSAIEDCKTAHPAFPPTFPQFEALCVANMPRTQKPQAAPALEMGQKLRSQYARKAREINAKHDDLLKQRATGFIELPLSLDGLKQSIAQAVALAGGDEAATLMRLDRELAPRVSA